jgi:hypothetical protein
LNQFKTLHYDNFLFLKSMLMLVLLATLWLSNLDRRQLEQLSLSELGV